MKPETLPGWVEVRQLPDGSCLVRAGNRWVQCGVDANGSSWSKERTEGRARALLTAATAKVGPRGGALCSGCGRPITVLAGEVRGLCGPCERRRELQRVYVARHRDRAKGVEPRPIPALPRHASESAGAYAPERHAYGDGGEAPGVRHAEADADAYASGAVSAQAAEASRCVACEGESSEVVSTPAGTVCIACDTIIRRAVRKKLFARERSKRYRMRQRVRKAHREGSTKITVRRHTPGETFVETFAPRVEREVRVDPNIVLGPEHPGVCACGRPLNLGRYKTKGDTCGTCKKDKARAEREARAWHATPEEVERQLAETMPVEEFDRMLDKEDSDE